MEKFRYGLFNADGNPILPMEYSNIHSESEGLIGVEKKGELAFVDREGNLKIPFTRKRFTRPQFSDDMLILFSHKLPILSKIKLFNVPEMYTTTVIDKQGKTLFAINGYPFSYTVSGRFLIDRGRKGYGVVTRSGRVYPLPKNLKSEGLHPRSLGENRVSVARKGREGQLYDQAACGLLKFTIKEK